MAECSDLRENLPLLLTETLDASRRELVHQHIESCPECSVEWDAYRETWRVMDLLPQVEVPARVRARFLEAAGIAQPPMTNVVPFRQRPAAKWVAQAAAVAVLIGGGFFFGRGTAPKFDAGPTLVERADGSKLIQPLSIAETRVVDANAVSPDIEGRPNISNVQFADTDNNEVQVSFDITSHWTVSGDPKEKSMVRLLSYMLTSDSANAPRSSMIEWVRRTYSNPANANPEIAASLAKVLRTGDHEGVRIRAVDTLTTLPPAISSPTRDALIEALRSDPNPAVRLKAVEALATMTRGGTVLDPETVDTLRQKAGQDDENLYVRVKAAEALSHIKP